MLKNKPTINRPRYGGCESTGSGEVHDQLARGKEDLSRQRWIKRKTMNPVRTETTAKAGFISETLGMMVIISIGNAAIANEVLKNTKGHALGLGFVAISYGLAFFVAISMFGHISANVNPAMLLAKALIGRLAWKDALVLSVANVLGGFLGGVMVYGLYFAHFSMVPERPSPPCWDDALVDETYVPHSNTRNAYISYEPRQRHCCNEEDICLPDGRRRFECKYMKVGTSPNDYCATCPTTSSQGQALKRANSIQVATILHEHDKARSPLRSFHERQEELDPECRSIPPPSFAFAETENANEDQSSCQGMTRVECGGEEHDRAAVVQSERIPNARQRLRQLAQKKVGGFQLHEADVPSESPGRLFAMFFRTARKGRAERENAEFANQLERDGITKKEIAAYRGMLIADQNAKLAAFASRPAVFNYGANTVAEAIGTFMLIWSALMLEERVNLLGTPDAADNLAPVLTPLLIGFLVIGLVTSMAGPTGYAANPARDLGPRIAHFVLPIPNKGPSEWYYACVPIAGPLFGAFLAAAVFYGCVQLNDYPDWFEGETSTFGGSWEL